LPLVVLMRSSFLRPSKFSVEMAAPWYTSKLFLLMRMEF
jgi:hypothetical protein